MEKKLKHWLDTKGRRLVELKLMGGNMIFGNNISKNDIELLSTNEWIEFMTLTGQFDAIIWAFSPRSKKRYIEFIQNIDNYMNKLENDCKHIFEITGRISIPKGYA